MSAVREIIMIKESLLFNKFNAVLSFIHFGEYILRKSFYLLKKIKRGVLGGFDLHHTSMLIKFTKDTLKNCIF